MMFPKRRRIRSQKTIDKIRQIGYCEHCGSRFYLQVHHIKSRGSGGDDTDDNLVCLCYVCHRRVHDGLIPRKRLREIVAVREEERIKVISSFDDNIVRGEMIF